MALRDFDGPHEQAFLQADSDLLAQRQPPLTKGRAWEIGKRHRTDMARPSPPLRVTATKVVETAAHYEPSRTRTADVRGLIWLRLRGSVRPGREVWAERSHLRRGDKCDEVSEG